MGEKGRVVPGVGNVVDGQPVEHIKAGTAPDGSDLYREVPRQATPEEQAIIDANPNPLG